MECHGLAARQGREKVGKQHIEEEMLLLIGDEGGVDELRLCGRQQSRRNSDRVAGVGPGIIRGRELTNGMTKSSLPKKNHAEPSHDAYDTRYGAHATSSGWNERYEHGSMLVGKIWVALSIAVKAHSDRY